MRNSEQEIKSLILYDVLRKETDEEHPLATDKLSARGIQAARQTVYGEMQM